jgi:hypothetical protein
VCNFNLADALSFYAARYHSIFRLLPRLISAERSVNCVLMRVLCDRVEIDADAGDGVGAHAMTSIVSSINLNSTLVTSHLFNMNAMNYSTMPHRLNGDTSSHIEGDRTDPLCRASSLSRPVRVVFSQAVRRRSCVQTRSTRPTKQTNTSPKDCIRFAITL